MARRRTDDAVPRGPGNSLAVHDHAARQHQPAPERPAPQRPQERRRADAVGRDVAGDVVEVDAQADHRRLVADRVDAVDRGLHRLDVGDVGEPDVDRRQARRRRDAIEDPDVGTAGDQLLDDVRADEAGAAGDENLHRARLAARPDRDDVRTHNIVETVGATSGGMMAAPRTRSDLLSITVR